jgi:hypothetical protein
VKFDSYWQAVEASLAEFLAWAFTGRVVPYKPRLGPEGLAVVWTAPHYIRASGEYFAELERQVEHDRRAQEALVRSRQLTGPQIARARAAAQSSAAEAEQAARNTAKNAAWRDQVARHPDVAGAFILLDRKWGVYPATVGWSIGDPGTPAGSRSSTPTVPSARSLARIPGGSAGTTSRCWPEHCCCSPAWTAKTTSTAS